MIPISPSYLSFPSNHQETKFFHHNYPSQGAVQKAGEQWQNPTLVSPKWMGFNGIMMEILWWLNGDMMGYWDCGNMGLWWDYRIVVRLVWDMNAIIMRFHGDIYQNPYNINPTLVRFHGHKVWPLDAWRSPDDLSPTTGAYNSNN